MSLRLVSALLGVLGLGFMLMSGTPVRSQDAAESDNGIFDQVSLLKTDDAKLEDGVQPAGKGPVHEAFAEPISAAAPQASPFIPKQPPELIEELPPQEKPEGDNVQWLGGYWHHDEDSGEFLWISGIWRNIPPGRQWVPGHHKQATEGWQWVSGFWTAVDQGEINVVPMPPPEPINEVEPPRPADNATYVAGNWVYHQTRYVWRSGFWCGYRPGWVWVPAHYVWSPCGYVFCEGYWDFPLQERGLLFAPCHIDQRVVIGGGFRFRPRYVVNDHCLMGALFVRPRSGCYYFGDYFDNRYQQRGFVSWTEVRIGRTACDPLFSYYRVHNHRDPRWERDLHELYHARRLGTVARPPVTLVQQNTIINNINKNVNIKNVNNVVMLAPVSKVNQKVVKIEKLDNTKILLEQKNSDRLRELSKQRANQETVLLASKINNPDKKDATVKNLKLDLPVQPKLNDGKVDVSKLKKTPPPSPVVLKANDKVIVDKKSDDKKNDEKKVPIIGGGNNNPNKLPEVKKLEEKKSDDKKKDEKNVPIIGGGNNNPNKLPEVKKLEEKKSDDKKKDEKNVPIIGGGNNNPIKLPDVKKQDDKKNDRPAGGNNPIKLPEIKKVEEKKIEEKKIDKGINNPIKLPEIKKVETPKPINNNLVKPPEFKKVEPPKPIKQNDGGGSKKNDKKNR